MSDSDDPDPYLATRGRACSLKLSYCNQILKLIRIKSNNASAQWSPAICLALYVFPIRILMLDGNSSRWNFFIVIESFIPLWYFCGFFPFYVIVNLFLQIWKIHLLVISIKVMENPPVLPVGWTRAPCRHFSKVHQSRSRILSLRMIVIMSLMKMI